MLISPLLRDLKPGAVICMSSTMYGWANRDLALVQAQNIQPIWIPRGSLLTVITGGNPTGVLYRDTLVYVDPTWPEFEVV